MYDGGETRKKMRKRKCFEKVMDIWQSQSVVFWRSQSATKTMSELPDKNLMSDPVGWYNGQNITANLALQVDCKIY